VFTCALARRAASFVLSSPLPEGAGASLPRRACLDPAMPPGHATSARDSLTRYCLLPCSVSYRLLAAALHQRLALHQGAIISLLRADRRSEQRLVNEAGLRLAARVGRGDHGRGEAPPCCSLIKPPGQVGVRLTIVCPAWFDRESVRAFEQRVIIEANGEPSWEPTAKIRKKSGGVWVVTCPGRRHVEPAADTCGQRSGLIHTEEVTGSIPVSPTRPALDALRPSTRFARPDLPFAPHRPVSSAGQASRRVQSSGQDVAGLLVAGRALEAQHGLARLLT